MKNSFILTFLIAFFLCFFLFSCKKADNNPVNPEDNKPTPLKFLSCIPNHGYPGSIVQITGKGFNYHKELIKVEFDSIKAEILDVLDTIIKVKVPNTAFGPIPISISRDTERVECKDCFIVTNPKDTIPTQLRFLSCIPNHGFPGSIIQITGKGFNYNKYLIKVEFGGIKADLLDIIDTIIKVKVPIAAFGPIPISISRDTEIVECKDCFIVTNPADTVPTSLQLISCIPTHGQQGSIVQIAGNGFNYHKDMIEVYFGGIKAKILNILDSLISVQVLNSPLGTISISINRDSEMVECKNCFRMTNSDFYFSKVGITFSKIQGTVVESSYSGNPGDYHYIDTSYLTNNYTVSLLVEGNYRNFSNQNYSSYFNDNSICIASGGIEHPPGGTITSDNHVIFIIDTVKKILSGFEALNSRDATADLPYADYDRYSQSLKFNNLPYSITKDGDLTISMEGLQINSFFNGHYLSKVSHHKFNGSSSGLKNFTIQSNSVLTITIYH